jgi:hypothetical protein
MNRGTGPPERAHTAQEARLIMLTAYDTLLSHLRSRFGGDDHRPVIVEHLLVLALIAVLSIVALDLLGDGLAAVDHLVSGPTSAP